MTPADVDVVILAGGLGTRARSYLGDTPKFLAEVRGVPLGLRLLRWLNRYGVRRAVLALGYGADRIERSVAGMFPNMDLMTVRDPEPEGEAAALNRAMALVASGIVMVMNGDTLSEVDLGVFASRFGDYGRGCCSVAHPTGVEHGVRLTRVATFSNWPSVPRPHELFYTSRPFVDIGTEAGYAAAQSSSWIDQL